MDAPLNEKIERALKRKAARKKNDSNFLPVLSLHEQVLSLVKEANSKVPQERHVTPRSVLIVMNRSLASLSSLDDESRGFAVLKEVSRFLNVATKTFTASQTDNTDLLVAGHPLSALNASLSGDEFLKKNASWLAADPSIHESIRPLVASAHSATPGSLEREHAFARLNASKTTLASYFKLDNLSPIVAAFSSGNSSAARRARVALQWRDKKGRWVEMGRGVNFRFRLPNGSIQVGKGNYIGAGGDTRVQKTSEGTSLVSDSGLIEVSGVPGLQSGLYVINSNNAAVYQARIPGYAAPEKPSFKDQLDADIPSLKDLAATRRNLPIGWKDNGAFYISDDNYAVVPSVTGQPQSVLRLDANGRPTGDSIGSVSNWSDVNAVIAKDEPIFDKEIARIEGEQLPLGKIPGATAKDVINPQDLLKMQEQRAQENKAIDEGKPTPQELGNNDLNGNAVPDGWVRDAKDDKAYTRELPLRDGGTYPVVARLNEDGTYIAGHAAGWIPEAGGDGRGPSQKFDSWNQIETQGLPGLVDYLNGTFTKDNPIEYTAPADKKIAEIPTSSSTDNVSPVEKVPTTSAPVAPGLFIDFNAPDGAFQLRTADYTPDGRVDEVSKDFTDDPKKLATKFTPQELVQAMSQALLGNSTDAAIAEILNANVDDNNDIVDPAAIQDNVDIPQVNVGQPSGAGQLEFSSGAEFVPAEALFNAIWEAGLDPNRVIANIYDSANGNNDNLNMLIEAQGGVPSVDEVKLVDDIMQEIRQLKDSSAPKDSPIANEKDSSIKPEPLPGKLIENLPIDFNNPDYYIPDPSAYVPSQPTVDSNGYTDNPQILAQDYYTADLMEQLLSGITDGSGAALLSFDNITVEVPIEAMRDALQYQDVNTNQILLDLKKESNDMSEPSVESDSPALQAHSELVKDLIKQSGVNISDEKANQIRDAIDQEGLLDWSEADDSEIIDAITEVAGTGIFGQAPSAPARQAGPPTTGQRQAPETPGGEPQNPNEPFGSSEILNELAASIKNTFSSGFSSDTKIIALFDDAKESMIVVDPGQGQEAIMFRKKRGQDLYITSTNAEADWYTSSGAQNLGWRNPTAGEQISLRNYVGEMLGEETPDEPAIESPAVPETPAAPSLAYPGPENRGYHPDNTVLDVAGKVMGKGTRVRASRDGRMGTVIAVQNIDSRTGERTPYVRVRFDDGSVAVRSALKVRATGDAQQAVPNDAQRQAPTPPPVPDVSSRLDAPILNPGAIATEGNIQGVNSLGTTPDRLKEFTNSEAKQSDYSVWGLRAGEIARASQDRVTLENIKKAAIDHQLAILAFREAPEAEKQALNAEITKRKEILDAMMKDTYGVRDTVTFGKNNYSLSYGGSNVFLSGTKEELQSGNQPISLSISMNVLDSNGRSIGSVNRTISGKKVSDPNSAGTLFEWQVKNNYLAINNAKDKKSGFATAYNRFMEDWYIANGVKEIHVQAAGGGSYQGGFVWALNGFNWETPASAETEVSTRLRMMRRVATNKGEIAQIERLQEKANAAKLRDGGLNLDTAPTPMELALVGWYPGAKTWTGKDLMAKNGWMGVKRLDPSAKEQIQSLNYDQIRASRKRVEAKENKPNVGREFVMTANSDEFQNKNPELSQYLVEIRDVLQNNRSLAVLSPAAKTALNAYVTKQLLTKEGRDLPMQDIFQLRKVLQAEAKADNPLLTSTNFGVGKDLAEATIEDISRNNVKGFNIKRLGMHESGYNETWLATHIASGQRFYIKKDDLATNYDINGPLSEIAATNIARGLGFEGAYNTIAGSSDPNVLVMQEAGTTLPLGSELKVASKVYDGRTGTLVALDGTRVSFNADNFINKMHTPEDAVRVVLLDLLINNQDRHNGNILYALDGVDPSKIRIFPIDHSLSSFALRPGDRNQYLFDAILGEGDGKIYDLTMPALTRAMKEEDLLALFRNEANALRESLKDGNIQLSGKELEMIIAKWGSLNNYRAAINERLDAMLSPNGSAHSRFIHILKPSFWEY
jgi:hypothetical protein